MKLSRKILGFALAATLFTTQFAPAMAADNDPVQNGDDSIQAQGNILANSVDSVTVPTTLKLAFNPEGYAINKRYVKVDPSTTTLNASDKIYYKEKSGGGYERDTSITSDATLQTALTSYEVYQAVRSTTGEQVVSLNYAIRSKSTKKKIVKIDFKATYTADPAKTPIDFVDAENKTQAYAAGTNEDGAKTGDLRLFLQIASADDTNGVKLYETYKRERTFGTASTIYYKVAGGKYVLAGTSGDGKYADEAAFKAETDVVYTKTNDISPETTGAELSDANITPAAAGTRKTFQKGTTNKADAVISYLLDKADYTREANADIDFDTTQSQLQNDILYCSKVNGVAGFTFTGKMTTDCDWTKADTTQIKITPKYTISDAKADESEAIAGTTSQVKLLPQIDFTAAGLITVTNSTCVSADLEYARATNGVNTFDLIGNSTTVEDPAAGTITIQMAQAWLDTWAGEDVTVSVKLKDGTILTSSAVTFPAN